MLCVFYRSMCLFISIAYCFHVVIVPDFWVHRSCCWLITLFQQLPSLSSRVWSFGMWACFYTLLLSQSDVPNGWDLFIKKNQTSKKGSEDYCQKVVNNITYVVKNLETMTCVYLILYSSVPLCYKLMFVLPRKKTILKANTLS